MYTVHGQLSMSQNQPDVAGQGALGEGDMLIDGFCITEQVFQPLHDMWYTYMCMQSVTCSKPNMAWLYYIRVRVPVVLVCLL